MTTFTGSFKDRAHALIEQLPDYATWYDLITKAEEQYGLDGSLEFKPVAESQPRTPES